jgi:hypothetical protein
MPDQRSPSPFWTKQPERAGQHRGDRSLYRAVGAAIVAGALAFDVALSFQSPALDLFPPKYALPDFLPDFANLRESPFLIDQFLDHELTGVPTGELPGLVELLEFVNHEFADFVDPEFTGVPTDESPVLVKLLEFLNHKFSGFSAGSSGGGSVGGSAGVPTYELSALVMLVAFLKQVFQELPEVPTQLSAALVMLVEFLQRTFPDVPTLALLNVGLPDPTTGDDRVYPLTELIGAGEHAGPYQYR